MNAPFPSHHIDYVWSIRCGARDRDGPPGKRKGPALPKTSPKNVSHSTADTPNIEGRATENKRRSDAEGSFRAAIRKQPVLAAGEDIELARRWRDCGDKAALDRLINSYLRLVAATARKIAARDVSREDILAEGAVALVTAAQTFDPDKGVGFATYASNAIRWAMQDAARLSSIKIDGKQVPVKHLPLDTPVGDEGDTFLDRLKSPPEEEDPWSEERLKLAGAMPTLEPREREIIEMRYLGSDDKTVTRSEVGKVLGISGERVRQIEALALAKLGAAA